MNPDDSVVRVLVVVEPGKDGVFRHVEGLVRHLISAGHPVALAYSSARSSDRLFQLVQDVRKSGGPILDLHVGNQPTLTDFAALFRLRRLATEFRPDVIHAHSSKAGALARLLPLVGLRRPTIYTPNAYFGMASARGARVVFFNTVESVLGRIGKTINVSSDEAAYAREVLDIPARLLTVIPNGVETAAFTPPTADRRRELRALLGIPAEAIVLGSVGRFSAQKDYETLYRALVPLLGQRSELVFLHIGEGEADSALRDLIERAGVAGQIRRVSYLADPRAAYHTMDAFAITSRYEGLSYAILEALASNLPLIVSDAPGNRDFLHMSLSHAWSAAAGDSPGFSRAITDWLVDRERGRPCNHREVAKSHFDLKGCCQAVINLYCGADPTRASRL